MFVENLRNLSKRKLSERRKIDYFVQSDRFEYIARTVSLESLAMLSKLIMRGNYSKLQEFCKQQVAQELEDFTIEKLRKRAQTLGITGFWGLSKGDLLLRILNVSTAARDVGPDVSPYQQEG